MPIHSLCLLYLLMKSDNIHNILLYQTRQCREYGSILATMHFFSFMNASKLPVNRKRAFGRTREGVVQGAAAEFSLECLKVES